MNRTDVRRYATVAMVRGVGGGSIGDVGVDVLMGLKVCCVRK